MPRRIAVVLSLLLAGAAGATSLETDRELDVFEAPTTPRKAFRDAAARLGDRTFHAFEISVDSNLLRRIAATPEQEPLVRAVREIFRRPVDVADLLLFLDDLVAAEDLDLSGVWVPSGRARNAGILLHPDDVFGDAPRQYGTLGPLDLTKPEVPRELEPAADGDPPGPRWTARFRNPDDEEGMLAALTRENGGDFAMRIRSLFDQLRAQGAECWVHSTTRSRERGYLMWGAFLLSRAGSEAEARRHIDLLGRRNREWGLAVPISWAHPDGWTATIEGARAMAEAYNVVFATEAGAKKSRHYGGRAADFTAVGLPRLLTLVGADGERRTFDLSDPDHPRDLSLDPEMIRWVERHFAMRKARFDYPHWEDAAQQEKSEPESHTESTELTEKKETRSGSEGLGSR